MTVELAADTEVFPISLTMVLSGASHGSFGVLLESQTITYNRTLTTFVPQWVALPHIVVVVVVFSQHILLAQAIRSARRGVFTLPICWDSNGTYSFMWNPNHTED